MALSQRINLVVGLLLIAIVLHLGICTWGHGIVGWQSGIGLLRATPLIPLGDTFGVYPRYADAPLASLVCGVMLPLLVLVANMHLMLGWMHASRSGHRSKTDRRPARDWLKSYGPDAHRSEPPQLDRLNDIADRN